MVYSSRQVKLSFFPLPSSTIPPLKMFKLTVVAFVLSFVASTLAYNLQVKSDIILDITFPNSQNGWTNIGPQK